MLTLLRNVNDYMNEHYLLVFSISLALALFVALSLWLSVLCPPAALAIGIGSWSLLGNIIPLIAIASLILSTLLLLAVKIFDHYDSNYILDNREEASIDFNAPPSRSAAFEPGTSNSPKPDAGETPSPLTPGSF